MCYLCVEFLSRFHGDRLLCCHQTNLGHEIGLSLWFPWQRGAAKVCKRYILIPRNKVPESFAVFFPKHNRKRCPSGICLSSFIGIRLCNHCGLFPLPLFTLLRFDALIFLYPFILYTRICRLKGLVCSQFFLHYSGYSS